MEYKIGMVIKGKITGIQPYGAFVSLDNNQQGLIHVSEVKHGFIKNISDELEIGQSVTVKIIDIDEYTKKISLSLRALETLDIPSNVKPKRHRRRRYTPQIGFETLRNIMPTWIEEAQQDEQNRIAEFE